MAAEDLPQGLPRVPPSRKGAVRKGAIIDAAVRLIAGGGLQAVTMRTVAAEAGLPLGTVTYYFADKDELVEAAFLRHTQVETARVVAAISRAGPSASSEQLASQLADHVVQGLTTHRAQLVVEYQFLTESTRREGLQRASAAWLQGLQAHLEAAVTALASAQPRTDARLLLAVLAGLEVDNLAVPLDAAAERAVRDTLRRLLAVLARTWAEERSAPTAAP
ncbi:TetR/AcrR family transcriptional regulator [Quadrisphaera sp. KR29]|uniref:TetR/AcrR family transcriptional regulator n=1 Tax=Quadrisphaera sp. KR29 TaxID=3461391 RepID=UPI00404434D8